MFNRLKSLLVPPRQRETQVPDAAVYRAADEFVAQIISHLKNEKGVHIETAIAAAGSMAGFLLLRATGVDLRSLTPGTAVFTDRVNETGPELLGFMSEVSMREGIRANTGWSETIPEHVKPLIPSNDLVRDLYDPFMQSAQRFGVPEALRPRIAAAAAIKLTRMGSQALSQDNGKALALWSMLSAAKTVPHHF